MEAKDRRKPRQREIRIDFGRDQVISGMHEAPDGTFTFFDEAGKPVAPVRIEIGRTYVRPGKPAKVLTRSAAVPTNIQVEPNRALLRFGFLVAVDTNTGTIGNTRVSVSVPVVIVNLVVGQEKWSAGLAPNAALEFHDAAVPSERVGWWDLIQRLEAQPELRRPIGLVVDSELGRLAAFNSRREPLFNDAFLPAGIELVYGCGDRGTQEFVANAAVADCDRIARAIMDCIRAIGLSGGYAVPPHSLYRRSRLWPKELVRVL